MTEIGVLEGIAFHCNLQRSATRLVKPHNFMHPDDKLVLEENSGRVKLAGNVPLASVYVTSLFHDKHIIPSEENSFSESDRSKLVFLKLLGNFLLSMSCSCFFEPV